MTVEVETARAAEEGRPRGRLRREAEEAAFRASVEQRLRALDSEVGEVKVRLNGLLFFIASTVLGQVLLRVLA